MRQAYGRINTVYFRGSHVYFFEKKFLRQMFVSAVLLFFVMVNQSYASTNISAPTFGSGLVEITIKDDRVDRPLVGHVWYPSTASGTTQPVNKSRVWKVADAYPNGAIAEGTFPLLVISHGMYGNRLNQSWLASELSRRGFIVAMVDHPGTSTFLRDVDQARQLWDRPVDLSRLISFLAKKSKFKHSIDSDRVYAAGHSLGGYTVLLTAGAKFDNTLYQAGCFGDTRIPVTCDVMGQWSVAESKADQLAMAQSRKDPRIRKVISMDLGGTSVFSQKSLAAIDIPVLILGSGRADMLDQNQESRALATALKPHLAYHLELKDAGHFDFLGICKPEGYAILKEKLPGDEIVCVKGGAEREVQHRRIVAEILSFLEE